jgi:hypothetical protein
LPVAISWIIWPWLTAARRRIAARLPELQVEVQCAQRGGAVQRDGEIAGARIAEHVAAEAEQVVAEVRERRVAVVAMHEAVHARPVVELLGVGEHVVPRLRNLEPVLVVQVPSIVEHLDVAVDGNAHQLAAARIERAQLVVPVDRVAVRADAGVKREFRIELGNGHQEAAVEEFDHPVVVDREQIVGAAAGAQRVANLVQGAGIRIDVELDRVAGLLPVLLDELAEPVEPGRLVDHHRDRGDFRRCLRRCVADGRRRQHGQRAGCARAAQELPAIVHRLLLSNMPRASGCCVCCGVFRLRRRRRPPR